MIVSWPRTLSSARSTQGSALKVTTTAETLAMVRRRPARHPANALPGEQERTGQRERQRDDEEEEAGREGLVRVDAEVPKEADEERLADRDSVHRDRQQEHEE